MNGLKSIIEAVKGAQFTLADLATLGHDGCETLTTSCTALLGLETQLGESTPIEQPVEEPAEPVTAVKVKPVAKQLPPKQPRRGRQKVDPSKYLQCPMCPKKCSSQHYLQQHIDGKHSSQATAPGASKLNGMNGLDDSDVEIVTVPAGIARPVAYADRVRGKAF